MTITRRNFIKAALIGTPSVLGFPYVVPSAVLVGGGKVPPSNRINLGLIGTGNVNRRHRDAFLLENDCRIIAVCDPVLSRRQEYQAHINRAYADTLCADYLDFRDLLARTDIDAVCIATPDHWHSVHTISALQAGKDVYVEKPLTLTVTEGSEIVKTTKRYSRILQTGLQRRSGSNYRYVCELVRNGRIGKLNRVEVGIIGINPGIQAGKNFPATAIPKDFDYDLWLGPAPFSPYCPQRVARGHESCYWYYIYDYSVGFISGNGIHFVDIAQWGIGDHIKPVEVRVISADIPSDGLIDDPIAWLAEVTYSNGVLMSYSSQDNPHPDGIRYIGDQGWIHISGGGTITASSMDITKSVIRPNEIHLYAGLEHHRNFLDCIKSRLPAAASEKIGHHATTTCNVVEISARLGRKVRWDASSEQFIDDDQANRLLLRSMRAPWHI